MNRFEGTRFVLDEEDWLFLSIDAIDREMLADAIENESIADAFHPLESALAQISNSTELLSEMVDDLQAL